MDDVGRLDAMQDHVHDGDDVGERLLFLAVEGAGLQRLELLDGQFLVALHKVVGLAQEAGRAACAVVDTLADLRLDDLYYRAD